MVSGCQVDDIYLNALPKLKAAYEKRKRGRRLDRVSGACKFILVCFYPEADFKHHQKVHPPLSVP